VTATVTLRQTLASFSAEEILTLVVVIGLAGGFVGLFAIFGSGGVVFAVCFLVVVAVAIRIAIFAKRPTSKGLPIEHTLLIEDEEDLGGSVDASSSEPIQPR
jgi:hypothetical protein